MNKTSTNSVRLYLRKSIVLSVVLILFFGGYYYADKFLQNEIQAHVRKELKGKVRTNVAAVSQWIHSHKMMAQAGANIPEINTLSTDLLKLFNRSNPEDIIQSALYEELDHRLSSYCRDNDFEEYFLISPDWNIFASSQQNYIAYKIKSVGANEFNHLNKPQPRIRLPQLYHKEHKNDDIVMFLSAPLIDTQGKAFAFLAFRLNPDKSFSKVMEESRSGESGKTYAIDKDGMMISNSRFVSELINKGLLKETETSAVLKISVKNREIGQSVLSGKSSVNYPNITSNVEGYKDYRGEKVVGAWTYLPEHGFALASEIDYSEAFSSMRVIRYIFGSVIALAAIFAVASIIYSFIASSMQGKIRQAVLEANELGQYQLFEILGEGAMGLVYRGEHKLMRRETAVKVLKPTLSDKMNISNFENEVKQTCRLTHPNTICLYDYGHTNDGLFYYAMELLDGTDIDSLIKNCGPLPAERCIYLLLQVCASLSEAHNAGLIHRDIKAHNVMVCQRGGEFDFVKVLDFGLVCEVNINNKERRGICGTPTHLSPEAILRPHSIDSRTDIYALGTMAYYMLTGSYPFIASSLEELLDKRLVLVPRQKFRAVEDLRQRGGRERQIVPTDEIPYRR
ncbi:MAG: serine/threonine protein kinase, partial [Lentisphaeraceae bacterium]|nr:serine/threonine protein kinase [Lentisphaeraceae bacterium]